MHQLRSGGGPRSGRGEPVSSRVCISVGAAGGMLRGVDPRDVRDAFLLDVREDVEWQEGHAPAAVHIPMYDVPQRVAELPDDRRIAVICHVGARSAQVAHWLRAQGYDAHNVEGGMESWAAQGLPVEGRSA